MVFESMTIEDDVFRELQANITRRLTPQPVRIRADVEVTCFSSEGIDAIKTALMEGEKLATEAISVKVKLVAPPLYVLLTTTTDKQGGIDLQGKALEEIGASIKKAGGEMRIKMEVSQSRVMRCDVSIV
jgi:translation initiation factor 2 subunit 1